MKSNNEYYYILICLYLICLYRTILPVQHSKIKLIPAKKRNLNSPTKSMLLDMSSNDSVINNNEYEMLSGWAQRCLYQHSMNVSWLYLSYYKCSFHNSRGCSYCKWYLTFCFLWIPQYLHAIKQCFLIISFPRHVRSY